MDRLDSASDLLQAMRRSGSISSPKAFIIFVDFSAEQEARTAAKALREAGCQVRLSKDGCSLSVTGYPSRESTHWIERTEHTILTLAAAQGGGYAGNEVEL
jgi:hypothetical protein